MWKGKLGGVALFCFKCFSSCKDKAAIIEAARKGGGKEAVREKMKSEYQISRTADRTS